jgi:aspartate dehydrogenase
MNEDVSMLDVTMVGCGAIGHGVIAALANDADVRVTQIVVPASEAAAVRAEFPDVTVAASLDELPARPGLLLECAGHRAVIEQVLPALQQGIDCVLCSVGALSEPGLPEKLEAAARASGAHAQLISGAIGAIDAIAAARLCGLDTVVYTGRKPPLGWKGTPAEDTFDLDHMTEAGVLFEGSARDAARLFPKNANVAATVSLAGIGLDNTRVRLIADPAVSRNQHHVRAEGGFGELEFQIAGRTLASNPKTSALTVYSAVRALHNRARPIAI